MKELDPEDKRPGIVSDQYDDGTASRHVPVLVDSDFVADIDFEGLSLYEKKSLLIQRELDSMGMGRYQWYIWSLCGLGYFLDLLWAQAFGLIATPLQKELGFSGIMD